MADHRFGRARGIARNHQGFVEESGIQAIHALCPTMTRTEKIIAPSGAPTNRRLW
jgi:hypothetical protein